MKNLHLIPPVHFPFEESDSLKQIFNDQALNGQGQVMDAELQTS